MRIGLQLTLDGMIRALRLKAHELAEDDRAARRQAEERNGQVLALLAAESQRASEGAGDERGR